VEHHDMYLPLTKHYSNDQIKKNETDWSWGTYGERERWILVFGGEIFMSETTWKA
jgi:hypothetical protein